MSWNYRVCVETYKEFDKKIVLFSVRGIHYDENYKPRAYDEEAVRIGYFETPKEIFQKLKLIKQAKKKPILWLDEDKLFEEYKE